MSNAVAGVGTRFRRWDGSVYQDVAEILSIDGPGMSREEIDVTNLDSTGGWREFIGSFRDGGTVELAMNFARATFELMFDDFNDDALQNYEIVLPDDEETTIEFEGLVKAVPLSVTADKQITANVTIKVSGEPVINSGASSGLTD